MPKNKRKPVHFEFGSHAFQSKYSKQPFPGKKIKTVLFEDPFGIEKRNFKPEELVVDDFKVEKSFLEYVKRAHRRGIKIKAGESFENEAQKRKLERLYFDARNAQRILFSNLTMNNIENFFLKQAEIEKFRHKLIINTIKNSEKPIEAVYGAAHSNLTKQLKKEGIESSRDLKPMVFDWVSVVTRKIVEGKTPSEIEYKRAFVSEFLLCKKTPELVFQKQEIMLTQREVDFVCLLENVLFRNLSKKQLNEIILTKDWTKVFTLNDFSDPLFYKIPKKKFVEFLNKHSSFWKLHQRVAKRKRDLRNKKTKKKK